MLRLVPSIYPWQQWPRGYEPTVFELEAMSEDEYELWNDQELRIGAQSKAKERKSHPSARVAVVRNNR